VDIQTKLRELVKQLNILGIDVGDVTVRLDKGKLLIHSPYSIHPDKFLGINIDWYIPPQYYESTWGSRKGLEKEKKELEMVETLEIDHVDCDIIFVTPVKMAEVLFDGKHLTKVDDYKWELKKEDRPAAGIYGLTMVIRDE
jgi:hypothetical protein